MRRWIDCVDPQDLQEDGDTSDDLIPRRHKAQPGRLQWVVIDEDDDSSEAVMTASLMQTRSLAMQRRPIGQATAPRWANNVQRGKFVVPENGMPFMAESFNAAPSRILF
ncbi:MAG: hypothetical protein IPG62_15695 [Sphingomonadales bacterium]|nr:hypothetical protein [Sphingomonadales bacterium]